MLELKLNHVGKRGPKNIVKCIFDNSLYFYFNFFFFTQCSIQIMLALI